MYSSTAIIKMTEPADKVGGVDTAARVQRSDTNEAAAIEAVMLEEGKCKSKSNGVDRL